MSGIRNSTVSPTADGWTDMVRGERITPGPCGEARRARGGPRRARSSRFDSRIAWCARNAAFGPAYRPFPVWRAVRAGEWATEARPTAWPPSDGAAPGAWKAETRGRVAGRCAERAVTGEAAARGSAARSVVVVETSPPSPRRRKADVALGDAVVL